MSSSPVTDSSDEECDLDEPQLLNLDCFISIITLHLPDGTVKDIVIDENSDDLLGLRRKIPNQRTSRKRNSFNSANHRAPSLKFYARDGSSEVEIPTEMEILTLRALITTLELTRFVKGGVLELHLANNDTSSQQRDSLVRQPDEVLRDMVSLLRVGELDIKRCLLTVKSLQDDFEIVLHSILDDTVLCLKPQEIEDLYPIDEHCVKVEAVAAGTILVRFENPENVNLFITTVVLRKRKASVSNEEKEGAQINDSRRFLVKKKNRYSFTQKRIVWLNCTEFTVHITDLKMKAQKHFSLGSLAHFIKKGKKQRKVLLEFEATAHAKPIFLVFENQAELSEFIDLAERIINSKTASKNKAKRELLFTQEFSSGFPSEPQRRYTWLSTKEPGLASLSYNCVQVNMFSKENRILAFDSLKTVLQLMTSDHKVIRTLQVDILVLTHVASDQCRLKIGGDASMVVIFSSVYIKAHFCSVVHSIKYPELTLTQGQKTLKYLDVGVFVGTWNLGHQDSDFIDSINKWLVGIQGHQVVALGFQECKKRKRGTLISCINTVLEAAGFSLLAFESMWEMFILVFIDKELTNMVSHVVKMAKATGIANVIGNKGGVLVSFSLMETSYCFLSCHLAASPHKVLARNQDIANLLKLKPGHPDLELTQEFDYVFVLGDLNYRTDEDFFVAVEMLSQHQLEAVLLTDQLTKQRQLNAVLTQFREASISFLPTYRISRDSPDWSNKKNQTPSWTDRILYRAHRPLNVRDYNSVPTALGSDHRPVFGSYITQAVNWYLPTDLKPHRDFASSFALLEFKTLKVTLNHPFTAKIAKVAFYAPFIEPTRGSFQVTLPTDCCEFSIQGDQMPMLSCIWSDFRFLREQRLSLVLWVILESSVSEVAGVASLSLAPLVDFIDIQYPTRSANFSCDETIPYSALLEYLGVQVGNIEGLWTYNEELKGERVDSLVTEAV
jgi:hypothetical protein